MSQSWNTSLVREINQYFKTQDLKFSKLAMRKGFLAPDGKTGELKLTFSGKKFMDKFST